MTTVNKLEIHGIRSFGIGSGDEQRIEFKSPLTLIVGQNGSGKTTIIECLKYAVSGELPPNSDKGKYFVHNTKMAGTSQAIGKVKLQVRDQQGNKTTIDRSIKATTKAGKTSANTLGCTVTTESLKGKPVSIQRRAADATAEMCQAMGVSKAIINNVIFCHQEDSNWPLDESKKVKLIFDAIFGTTDYNKVIDELMKKKKDRDVQKKVKEVELKDKRFKKAEADFKNAKLQKCEEDIENHNKEIAKIEKELEPIKDRKAKIIENEMKVSEIYKEQIEVKAKLEANEKNQEVCKKKIKKIFEGDMGNLQREIRNFQTKVSQAKTDLEYTEESMNAKKSSRAQFDEKLEKLKAEKIKFQQKMQDYQDKNSDRAEYLGEITKKLNVSVPDDLENQDKSVVQRIISSVTDAVKAKETEIKNMKREHDLADQALQKKVNEARDKSTVYGTNLQSQSTSIKTMEKELQETQANIIKIEASATELTDINEKIQKLETQQETMNSQQFFTEARQKITDLKKNRTQTQHELDQVDEKIESLTAMASTMNEISFKETQLKSNESEFRRIQNKHSSNLRRLFSNTTIESEFKRSVQQKYDELERQVKSLKDGMNKKQNELTECKLKHRHLRDQVSKAEEELKVAKDAKYDTCQNEDYDTMKEKVKEKLDKLRMELSSNQSADKFYNKYIADMQQEPCCPLCHKDLDAFGKDDLIIELSDKIRSLPAKIREQEQALKREEVKYNDLLKLETTISKIEELQKDIPALENEIRALDDKQKDLESSIEDAECSLSEPEENKNQANNMLSDMSTLDRLKADIDKINSDIAKLKAKIPSEQGNERLDDLKQRKKEGQDKLRKLHKDIEAEEHLLDAKQKQLQSLQETRNKLLQAKVILQEKAQTLPQLKERINQLKSDIENARQKVFELNDLLKKADEELNSVTEQKQKKKEENKRILDKIEQEKQAIDILFRDIIKCNDELATLEELNISSNLNRIREQLERTTAAKTKNEEELQQIQQKLDQLKEEIANQENQERDLAENLELRKAQRDYDVLKEQYDALKSNLGEMDLQRMNAEKQKLQSQEDELNDQRNLKRGGLTELQRQANGIRDELQKTEYKEAHRNYMRAYQELYVLELIIKDIMQYRTALDMALTKYHQEKMAFINQTIRTLWREIYQGNDIDYIEIRTEDAPETSTAKRRNYEYRVVQCKNNAVLDMRGRCSAGQKVLASLIIRLALCETFSSNCGVMALDEPTTNLDQANIQSLCEAIGIMIKDRAMQGNFTLIIITHDETFLQTLGPYLEQSYRVGRDNSGKSIIQRVD